MPKKPNIKTSDLNGLFIYQDPKSGTVYYDILTKKGYVLTTSDIKTYTIYSSMFSLCLLLSMGLTYFANIKLTTALIIFVLLYIGSELLFRFAFFYKLPEADNFKPFKRDSIITMFAKKLSVQRLIVLIILLVALVILMPIYANMSNFTGLELYITYIIEALLIAGTIISIAALISKKKNNY